MEQMSLDDKNGQTRVLDLFEIETTLGTPADETGNNCVMITAKKKGEGWHVVDVVGIHGNGNRMGLYFKSWFNVDAEGQRVNFSFQLGATHYGVIWCDDEMTTAITRGALEHLRER